MPSILDRIVAKKREELAVAMAQRHCRRCGTL